jgi:tetrahydromethanopterin S-methyltransferase subunit G
MVANIKSKEDEKLFQAVLKLNTKFLGLAFGIVMGLIIFIATNWLLIKGGATTPNGEYIVGPHLQLLGQFFIGYRVSFLGSIIGFLYGFAIGTLCGAVFGLIYNKIVDFRN